MLSKRGPFGIYCMLLFEYFRDMYNVFYNPSLEPGSAFLQRRVLYGGQKVIL